MGKRKKAEIYWYGLCPVKVELPVELKEAYRVREKAYASRDKILSATIRGKPTSAKQKIIEEACAKATDAWNRAEAILAKYPQIVKALHAKDCR